MREIKFRMWWLPKDNFKGEMAMASGYLWEEMGMRGENLADTNEFVLMQYTGLKDKNGIEIYEKDIIILEPDEAKEYFNEPTNLSYGDVCIVEWSNTNLAYYLMPVNEDIEEQQMDYYGAWSGWNWIKVIGNCYENPELLKGAV